MGGEESKEGDKHKGGQDLRREDILRPVDGAELQTGIDVDQGPGQHTEGSGPEEGFQGDTDHPRQIVDDEDGKNRQDPESHQIADAVPLDGAVERFQLHRIMRPAGNHSKPEPKALRTLYPGNRLFKRLKMRLDANSLPACQLP